MQNIQSFKEPTDTPLYLQVTLIVKTHEFQL